MAVKTLVPLIMMVVVLCASAGASTTGPDDTLVADEVGVYAYPPAPSPAGLDDDDSLVAEEVAQYATTPAPSPLGLDDDDSLLAEEVAQYASAPAPSGGIEGAFLQLGDDVGLYAPAPTPISAGFYDNLLGDTLVAAGEVSLSAAAPSPSTGLGDTQPQQPLSLLSDSSDKDDGVAEKESIQKVIDTEGCIYEIITFANYKTGEEVKVGPACCKAVLDIVNNKNWPNIFPFNPAFPHKIKVYCARYGGSSPASAPTTSYAPALAPAPLEGPAYAPDQGDWLY